MDKKLFFYNSDFHNHYGKKNYSCPESDLKYYGMFVPSVNRFVLVTVYLDIAKFLSIILQSRMQVLPMRIDSSVNFSKELIDNGNCFYMGVDRASDKFSPFSSPPHNTIYEHQSRILDVNIRDTLLPEIHDMLLETQKWAFLCHHVKLVFEQHTDAVYKVAYDLIDCMGDNVFRDLKQKEQACYRHIWLDDDYDTAEAEVLDILQSVIDHV